MWHSERRYSSDSSGEDEVPYKTLHKKAGGSAMTLNLEWDWEDKEGRADSPRTLSLAGGEGRKKKARGRGSGRLDAEARMEDSEADSFVNGEGERLDKG